MRWLISVGVALVLMRLANVVSTTVVARYPGVVGWVVSLEFVIVVGLVLLRAVYGVVRLVAHVQRIDARVPSHVWSGLTVWVVPYTLLVAGGGVIYQNLGPT